MSTHVRGMVGFLSTSPSILAFITSVFEIEVQNSEKADRSSEAADIGQEMQQKSGYVDV